jgi:hypothetical protein
MLTSGLSELTSGNLPANEFEQRLPAKPTAEAAPNQNMRFFSTKPQGAIRLPDDAPIPKLVTPKPHPKAAQHETMRKELNVLSDKIDQTAAELPVIDNSGGAYYTQAGITKPEKVTKQVVDRWNAQKTSIDKGLDSLGVRHKPKSLFGKLTDPDEKTMSIWKSELSKLGEEVNSVKKEEYQSDTNDWEYHTVAFELGQRGYTERPGDEKHADNAIFEGYKRMLG